MTNNCTHFKEDPERITRFANNPHSCWVCRWRSHDNPNQCTPPGLGFCATEDRCGLPKIVSSNIELIILNREARNGPLVGNIHKVVSICPDGYIFVKEVFVDPSTIMFHKKILRSESFNNYCEFCKKYHDDANLINKYLSEKGICLDRWLKKEHD